MKTYIDCVPCFFRQAIEASKMAGVSKIKQKNIIDELAGLLRKMPFDMSPPEAARLIYKIVHKYAQKKDVYKKIKDKSNLLGLQMYERLKNKVLRSKNPLFKAVEVAIAGNIIDYGAKNHCDVDRELAKMFSSKKTEKSRKRQKIFDYKKFASCLKKSKDIIYLADNAGETVFDRVLIEQIKKNYPDKNIIYVVKDRPVINDALKHDAYFCGIDKSAHILSSGSDAPGTVLSLCSDEFLERFGKAHMIISKGQGNFEALSASKNPIFFLFMIKCAVISNIVGAEIGQRILMSNQRLKCLN
jgi:uncharacterized protein with ATP-grasp and redox domains